LFSQQPFGILISNFTHFFLKRSTSNCRVKCDSVEKRRSYRLFNITGLNVVITGIGSFG